MIQFFQNMTRHDTKHVDFHNDHSETALVRQPLDELSTLGDPLCSTFTTVVSSVGTKCSVMNGC